MLGQFEPYAAPARPRLFIGRSLPLRNLDPQQVVVHWTEADQCHRGPHLHSIALSSPAIKRVHILVLAHSQTWARPHRICGLHGLLHLLGYFLQWDICHSHHKILSNVHSDLCLPLERSLSNRGVTLELSDASRSSCSLGTSTMGFLSLLDRAQVASLITIVHCSSP